MGNLLLDTDRNTSELGQFPTKGRRSYLPQEPCFLGSLLVTYASKSDVSEIFLKNKVFNGKDQRVRISAQVTVSRREETTSNAG